MQSHAGHDKRTDRLVDALAICGLVLLFYLGILRQVDLPGLYMDSVNPDYLAVRALYPGLDNPASTIPSAAFPILGNLYYGVQNYYFDLIVFHLLDVSVTSVRVAQAIFGAAIVGLLYTLASKITRNRLIAFLAAALLATDIAFLASFRTQFYIVLGGGAWLFASLLALWYSERIGYAFSGLFFGLAIYGYFVLGFFAPAMVFLMLSQPNPRPAYWLGGFFIGLLPYMAGYLSLVVASGGVSEAVDWVRTATHTLKPLSSQLSPWGRVQIAARDSYLALTNIGNELMIFGQSVGGRWGSVKIAVFLVSACLAAYLRQSRRFPLFLLPISFITVAALFGDRLWAHHYVVLLPIAYLILAHSIGYISRTSIGLAASVAIAVIFIVGNLHQANKFHRQLDQTGGIGFTTNALTLLAEEALAETDTLYVFPEWGFYMPFNLLTKNRIPFILEVSSIPEKEHLLKKANVAIAFWSATDERKYTDGLKQAGFHEINTRIYRQRDGKPAFYLVRGRSDNAAQVGAKNLLKTRIVFFVKPSRLHSCDSNQTAEVFWDVTQANVGSVNVFVGELGKHKLFAAGGARGRQITGPWVKPGLEFTLKNMNDEELANFVVGAEGCIK